MRFVFLAVLSLGCVSSSIQLGDDDAGPGEDTGPTPDAGNDLDVPIPPEDVGGDDVGILCDEFVAPPYVCYNDACEPELNPELGADCIPLHCHAAPPECFETCDDHRDCFLGQDCCIGTSCEPGSVVARNGAGEEASTAACGDLVIPANATAICASGRCEVYGFEEAECDPGNEDSQCAVVPRVYEGCEEDVTAGTGLVIAIKADKVDSYLEIVCPLESMMLDDLCCRQQTTRTAYCNPAGRCEIVP